GKGRSWMGSQGKGTRGKGEGRRKNRISNLEQGISNSEGRPRQPSPSFDIQYSTFLVRYSVLPSALLRSGNAFARLWLRPLEQLRHRYKRQRIASPLGLVLRQPVAKRSTADAATVLAEQALGFRLGQPVPQIRIVRQRTTGPAPGDLDARQ